MVDSYQYGYQYSPQGYDPNAAYMDDQGASSSTADYQGYGGASSNPDRDATQQRFRCNLLTDDGTVCNLGFPRQCDLKQVSPTPMAKYETF
jgi:hypothetical protein